MNKLILFTLLVVALFAVALAAPSPDAKPCFGLGLLLLRQPAAAAPAPAAPAPAAAGK